jgi:hypothetical protein
MTHGRYRGGHVLAARTLERGVSQWEWLHRNECDYLAGVFSTSVLRPAGSQQTRLPARQQGRLSSRS